MTRAGKSEGGRPGADEAAPGDPVAVVPRHHLCARCGYPSGASGSAVCPECGWRATRSDVDAEARRREVVARWRAGERARAVGLWGWAVVAYSVGLASVARSYEAGVLGAFVLVCAVPLTWWAGGWGLARCRPERREYLRVVWWRGLWVLHMPWLVAPAFVVVALLVGMVDLWAGDPRGGAYERVVTVGLGLWVLGCIGAFAAWWELRRRAVAHGGYRLGRADLVAFLLGLAAEGAACALGFGAGTITALGVARWLGLSGFPIH